MPAGDEEEIQGTKCTSREMRRASTATATRARYLEPRGIKRSEISRQVLKPTGPDSRAIVKRSLPGRSAARHEDDRKKRLTMKGAVTMRREDSVIRMH